jgi:hypothetical protein
MMHPQKAYQLPAVTFSAAELSTVCSRTVKWILKVSIKCDNW